MASPRAAALRQACRIGASITRARGIEVELDHHCAARSQVILLVGSDGRSSLPRSLRRLRARVDSRRADAIGVLIVGQSGRISLFRVPRDAFVEVSGVGYQRIGWALDYGGPQCLIDTARSSLDIPVHHYIEVGFTAFARLVAAHGGLHSNVAGGRKDQRTGLVSRRWRRLSGRNVLALARSRTPAGGEPMTDLERIATHDEIISALIARRSPRRLILSGLWVLPRLGRDLLADDAWTAAELERTVSTALTRPFSMQTLPLYEPNRGGSTRSPFAAEFVSSPPVLEFSDVGLRDLHRALEQPESA